MRGFKKNAVWKVCLGVTVVLLLTMDVSSAIYNNGGGKPFGPLPPPVPRSERVAEEGSSVEFYVINGAGYFLRSCSDFLLFLNKAEAAEIEGPDFDALKLNLNNGIANMEVAREVYLQLIQLADVTPYDPLMIDKLLNFNYDKFQEKHDLIKPVFDEVRYYLGSGAVREFFSEILCQMDEILNSAYALKAKVEKDEFPGLSSLWGLQHKCCKSMLIGQYASRVFLKLNE